MTAAALSNAVDKVHFEEREKSYLTIAGKYNKAELEAVAEKAPKSRKKSRVHTRGKRK